MASGEVVGLIHNITFPTTLMATPDIIVGASTPAESIPVYDFDAATIEYLDFLCSLYGYGGGGLTVEHRWSASTATTNEVVWSGACRRIADDADDLDTTAHTYDYNNSAAVTAPSAVGEVSYDNITFTDGVDMDSVADTEYFIYRLRRFATDAGDDMAGDAELHNIVILET